MIPKGWEKSWSKSNNREYYFNKELNKSVWSIRDIYDNNNDNKSSKSIEIKTINNNDNNLSIKNDDVVRNNDDKLNDNEDNNNNNISESKRIKQDSLSNDNQNIDLSSSSSSILNNDVSVAIIVPFRDLHIEQKRMEHLEQFVPHMIKFLGETANIKKYHVYIIEQSDDKRKFNRGKLLNIGYRIACDEGFNSFIFHDVDLLPQPILAEWYAMPPNIPIHIAKCWDRYNGNEDYLGGIVSFNRDIFEKVDGFPNIYWGWGGEDDELRARLKYFNINILSPDKSLPNAIIDLENMNLQEKLSFLKKTDWKCNVKWEINDAHKIIRESKSDYPLWWGLKGLKFDILNRDDKKFLSLSPDGKSKCSIIKVDVKLNFEDEEQTNGHWSNTKMTWQ